jgi:hypothetical protein
MALPFLLSPELQVSPTNQQKRGMQKVYDIIVPTFRSAGDENCYIFAMILMA